VKDYTHSTAPNRRFPDLITQRLLKAAMAGAPLPYTIPELAELAKHCAEREDDATKVERRFRKSAAALLLSAGLERSSTRIVTGASPKGTWVRLSSLRSKGSWSAVSKASTWATGPRQAHPHRRRARFHRLRARINTDRLSPLDFIHLDGTIKFSDV
jgi:exoribonuclease R